MSGKGDAWMPLYIADFARDTPHLDAEKIGVYLLLIMALWTRGGSLPNDSAQLASIGRVSRRSWASMSPVILEFFTKDGNFLRQKRVTAELERAQKVREARSENGKKGGRPSKLTESEQKANGKANDKLTETHARVALQSQKTTSSSDLKERSEPDPDLDRRAWNDGVRLLMGQSGVSEKHARSFFGRLLSENKLMARQLLPSLAMVEINGTPEPQAYLSKAAKGVGAPFQSPAERAKASHDAYVRSNII